MQSDTDRQRCAVSYWDNLNFTIVVIIADNLFGYYKVWKNGIVHNDTVTDRVEKITDNVTCVRNIGSGIVYK